MKKIAVMFCMVALLSCDAEVRVDEDKIEKAGEDLEHSVEKGIDTVGARLDRFEDRIDRDDSDDLHRDTIDH